MRLSQLEGEKMFKKILSPAKTTTRFIAERLGTAAAAMIATMFSLNPALEVNLSTAITMIALVGIDKFVELTFTRGKM